MKRSSRTMGALALPLALAANLAATPAVAAPSNAGSGGAETDGILITLDDDVSHQFSSEDGISLLSSSPVVQDLEDAGIEATDSLQAADGSTMLSAVPAEGQSDAEALEQAKNVEGVAEVQYNFVYHLIDSGEETADAPAEEPDIPSLSFLSAVDLLSTLSVNDEFAAHSTYSASQGNQYWAYATDLVNAWAEVDDSDERAVTVAVLDSGAWLDHPDLQDNVLSDLAYEIIENDEDQIVETPLKKCSVQDSDSRAHGTNVTGIVSATANNRIGLAGASNNTSYVLPIKVFDNYGESSSKVLIEAFYYLFQLVDSGQADIKVINMSLRSYASSMGEDSAFHDVIKTALNSYGILCVCAGGNDGQDTDKSTPGSDPMFPSDFEECVAVTALNHEGDNISGFDYNAAKDISAPGQGIWSTGKPSAGNGYISLTGTSQASPIVAGTIALMYAVVPDAEPDDILEALYSTADPVAPSSAAQQANGSHGALDADDALRYLQEHVSSETPEPDPEPATLPFADVQAGDWYYDAVSFVYNLGIMTGYSGTDRFAPQEPILREQMAQLLYNYLGNGEKAKKAAPQIDVDQSKYYANAVNWAVESGIMSGYTLEDGDSVQFGVGDELTREQLARVIRNIAKNGSSQIDATNFFKLPDSGKTSSWAIEDMQWAVCNGVISGIKHADGTKTLEPQQPCSRAQTAQIMMNCLQANIL